MAQKKLFMIQFQRIGSYHNRRHMAEAVSVAALEAPIQEFVDAVLKNQNVEVTIEPAAMKGQLDYGLKGEFTITAMT